MTPRVQGQGPSLACTRGEGGGEEGIRRVSTAVLSIPDFVLPSHVQLFLALFAAVLHVFFILFIACRGRCHAHVYERDRLCHRLVTRRGSTSGNA